MKPFNKEEYNKLCAEFLGWKQIKDLVEQSIQSLQKYPKWIVMESEADLSNSPYTSNKMNNALKALKESSGIGLKPKLITNSEGKQEGIIKEIIYVD